ncbi:SUKH-3 domain-containing protein [Streptomyces sp. NPDC127077]|uniref:SUKH-3 domain-containing protein n=1 Tax=Streptomyces sp. NPDC127077 TaxID=3347131 RepID=UPI003656CE2D
MRAADGLVQGSYPPLPSGKRGARRQGMEFGGLSVDVSGPGVSCAREPFEIDPELAVGEEDRFADLSERFGRRFLPLGEVGTEFFLAIDEDGILYLLAAWVFRLGPSDEALENLIRGVKAEKLRLSG